MTKKLLALLLIGSTLGGCASTSLSSAAPLVADGGPAVYDTRAFHGRCMLADPEEQALGIESLVAAVLPALIEQSFKRFAAAIRRAGEASHRSVSADLALDDLGLPGPVCIQIVRGWFLPVVTASSVGIDGWFAFLTNLSSGDQAQKTLNAVRHFGLAAAPDFFYEGVLLSAATPPAVAVSTNAVMFDRPIEAPTFGGGGRDVVVSFAFSAPSATEDRKASIAHINLGRLLPGLRSSIARSLGRKESAWITIPALAAEKNANAQSKGPLTLTATVTETRDANAFLLFVADILDASKTDIETALKTELVATEKAKADQARLVAERARIDTETALITDALTKRKDAEIARAACQAELDPGKPTTPGRRAELEGDWALKRALANLAAAKAGRSAPYEAEASCTP